MCGGYRTTHTEGGEHMATDTEAELRVAKAWCGHLTDERLACELDSIVADGRGHNPRYKTALLTEAASRIRDLSDKVKLAEAIFRSAREEVNTD